MERFTRSCSQVRDDDLEVVGGKGVNLARLARLGLQVPPWYAITTAAFAEVSAAAALDERLAELVATGDVENEDAMFAEARLVREAIAQLELPSELWQQVWAAHIEHLGADACCAVRSSATAEDSGADSFAGLHDSVLYVRGEQELAVAVRRVWASAYSERALSYRMQRALPLRQLGVAVLVQTMVDAAVSGVMFTVNPNTGDVFEVVISSLYGAGEGLVSAGLDADTFVWDKQALEVSSTVVCKTEQLVQGQGGDGLVRCAVPRSLQSSPSLDPQQIQRLAAMGTALETALGRPQDVEFSFGGDGELWVLQTRPVTTLEEYGPAAGNQAVWDNSNIIESYAGVTTPMTFSFIRHAYTIVYHCFAEVMGIKPAVVHANRHTFANMLGLFRGQVYYNLHNWYRLIRLFPGYSYNARFMESMMGVRQRLDLGEDDASPSWSRRYFVELPALVRQVLRGLRHFLCLRGIVDGFDRHFGACFGRWSALELERLPPHRLMTLYREMEEELLWQWKAPIINDFYVMMMYGALKKLCGAWCGDSDGSLQNDLICGEGGIESTKPTRLLLEIAAEIAGDRELDVLFRSHGADELPAIVATDPRCREVGERIAAYLGLYGFRCANELKLEEPSLKERPEFLYQMIRNYLEIKDSKLLDPKAAELREQRVRGDAERRAFACLPRMSPKRVLFRWVLGNARLGVKNRENMRFARTRIYGLLRDLLRALARHLVDEGILDSGDDIFYLTLDEVWDYIKGTAVTTDLRGLAALRRREFACFREQTQLDPADRFSTFGMAYHRNRFKGRPDRATAPQDGVLRGIGCCPGEVSGVVKVLRSPNEDAQLAGEILVAERTDPGWVPLYPAVSGILIERGSILSHSAIVAREMGIPTIVAIPGLTAALVSGDTVRMNGTTGEVVREAKGRSGADG